MPVIGRLVPGVAPTLTGQLPWGEPFCCLLTAAISSLYDSA